MSVEFLPPPLDQLTKSDRKHRSLASGDILFDQDSASTGLFYLVSGTIDLKRLTKDGHSIVIHRARSGDTFAEASVFSDNYHCTAMAVIESQIIECARSAISELLDTNVDFARSMAYRFAMQIQESRRRVELLSIRSADERILAALHDGLLVDNISSFAEVVGLAPETVYRTLGKLNKKGLIVKTARGIYRTPN
ncbi:MAG: Crp/Fnr family transcriptional regulator [Gammaproteobacteria bacterium]|nr:Crp/Fnr family transcriptional regulator [Gammaproteobacteria bacterium]